jgi:streptomycin 6-kinase
LTIPQRLLGSRRRSPARMEWLGRLPSTVHDLEHRWSLTLEPSFEGQDVSAAWVAPAVRADGSSAVLKLNMSDHPEADHEIEGLRLWDGDPTVNLLEVAKDLGAHASGAIPDRHVPPSVARGGACCARSSRTRSSLVSCIGLWRVPDDTHPFRPLSRMLGGWADQTRSDEARWPDRGLVLARHRPPTGIGARRPQRPRRRTWALISGLRAPAARCERVRRRQSR